MRKHALRKSVALAAAVAALGLLLSFVPAVLDLEETVDLFVLFSLRGQRPPPADVVVVSVDSGSAEALGLPRDVAKWPRSIHARLTDNIARAEAAIIVFDIFFDQGRSGDEDATFADAIARAGMVVLSKYIARETHAMATADRRSRGSLNIERLLSPAPVLDDAALVSAPFPLPKVPVRVNQHWNFKSEAGDTPTLPVVTLHLFAGTVYDDFIRLLVAVNPEIDSALPRGERTPRAKGELVRTIMATRSAFLTEPKTGARMRDRMARMPSHGSASRQRLLQALIALYEGPSSRYLNFYGPPRTIATVPYHEVIGGSAPPDFRHKIVFVGLSEYLRPEQKDGFYTVFSDGSGLDLSGVEIAATAFANLRDDQPIRPLSLPWHITLVVLAGVVLGACSLLAPGRAAAIGVVFGMVYLAVAQYRFSSVGDWYPLTVPLVFQLPFAIIGAIIWRYADANRERRRIRQAFSYYIPDGVIDQLLKTPTGIASSTQVVYGVCLATDAEKYTALGESLGPAELARFMNGYYEALFEPVRRHGGFISDVIGDAALAVWAAAGPDPALRKRGCSAACDIARALDQFNRTSPMALPTRIGLHSGRMSLGNVGAMDHYEYRAVGEIVNSTTRIQGLNKHLGTRVLASEETVYGLDAFLTRKLGTFLLAGKSRPLVVHEVIGLVAEAEERQFVRCTLFAEALAAYQRRSWNEANDRFVALLREHGDDAVCALYVERCERYLRHAPGDAWDAVIRIETK